MTHMSEGSSLEAVWLFKAQADVVGAARRLDPRHPGELDHPARTIGRYWCHPTGPKCPNVH